MWSNLIVYNYLFIYLYNADLLNTIKSNKIIIAPFANRSSSICVINILFTKEIVFHNTLYLTIDHFFLIKYLCMFFRVFEGYARLTQYLDQVKKLQRDIGDPTMYNSGYFYKAGYQRPSATNRHNEVWLIGKFVLPHKSDVDTKLNIV